MELLVLGAAAAGAPAVQERPGPYDPKIALG